MVGTVFKEKHKAILSYWQSHKTFPFPILIDIHFWHAHKISLLLYIYQITNHTNGNKDTILANQ